MQRLHSHVRMRESMDDCHVPPPVVPDIALHAHLDTIICASLSHKVSSYYHRRVTLTPEELACTVSLRYELFLLT